jgi:hypothetical protein
MVFVTDTEVLQEKVRFWSRGTTRKSRRSNERNKALENSWGIGWRPNPSKSEIDNVLGWNLELERALYRFSRRIQPSHCVLFYTPNSKAKAANATAPQLTPTPPQTSPKTKSLVEFRL